MVKVTTMQETQQEEQEVRISESVRDIVLS